MQANLSDPLMVVGQILNGLDVPGIPLSQSIRGATRVARLTEDYYAVWWLTRETIEFEDKEANDRLNFEMVQIFDEASFDDIQKQIVTEYLERRGTWASLTAATTKGAQGKVDTHTIAGIEQSIETLVASLADTKFSTDEKIELRFRLQQMRNIIERVKAKVHDYLVKVEARLAFEQKNQDVFDEHIATVNGLLEEHAPDVALMFTAAYDRIRDANPEALHQAGTTCRRILKAVADILYPARDPITDSAGRDRIVDEEHYVNRLLAYAEANLPSTMGEAWKKSLTDLAGRLDAMVALTSKGVHAPEFALFEARHAAMQTYLVVGDLLRLQETQEREVV